MKYRLLLGLLPLALPLPSACGTEEAPEDGVNITVNKGGSKNSGGAGAGGSTSTGGATASAGTSPFPNGSSGNAGQGGTSGSSGQTSAGGTSTGGTSGGSGQAGGTGGAGGTAPQPLPCDSRFSLSKNPPKAGKSFQVTVTDPTPFAWIDLQAKGPGNPAVSDQIISGQGPYQWTWTVSGHAEGVLALTFFRDKPPGSTGVVEATCQVQVQAGATGTGGSGGSTGGGGSTGTGGTSAGNTPPTNRYGIGLVSQGNASDHDLAAKLAGPGGHVLVIFADMTPGRHDADPSWKESISQAYARDLIPVVRLAPPWGNRNVRAMGESPTSYKGLAQAYKDVVASLPKRDGWPLYLAIHNEPNLCYEWVCSGGGWITEDQIANEYAHYLADVADAIHSLGDARLKVTMGALAPGGVTKCQCDGEGWEGGTTALTFLEKMKSVPGVFDKLDVWASHSYPAKGAGFGFFCPLPEAELGLRFFEQELNQIGKPGMKVLITETGWSTDGDAGSGCPPQSRDQIASFTVDAYKNVWESHPNILGVTPFMLRDSNWERFAWTQVNGSPYPVYNAVRNHRCSKTNTGNCN